MPSLDGKLIEEEKALRRAALSRKKAFLERSVIPHELEEYEKKGLERN